jgi:hypothetical protein
MKLTEMTQDELWRWAHRGDNLQRDFPQTFAALRDGVVAEVRAECEECAERCTRLSDHGKAWEDRARKAERERDDAKGHLFAAHEQLRAIGVAPKPPLGFAPEPFIGSRRYFEDKVVKLEAALAEWQASEDDWKRRFAEMRARAERAERELASAGEGMMRGPLDYIETHKEDGTVMFGITIRPEGLAGGPIVSGDVYEVRKVASYAPPVPASVTLGGYAVTYERDRSFPWRLSALSAPQNTYCSRWVDACSAACIDPTDEQIAALRALGATE